MRLFASHTSKSMMPSFVLITTLEYSLPVQGVVENGEGQARAGFSISSGLHAICWNGDCRDISHLCLWTLFWLRLQQNDGREQLQEAYHTHDEPMA